MKLVLDEMWSMTIAIELRRRGFEAIAITELENAGRYGGIPDNEVFAHAQEDARAVVTDNIPDYEKARLDWEAEGREHCGVIYALNPPFNRHRGEAVIGQMVKSLERLLESDEAQVVPFNRTHFLRGTS